MYPKCQTAYSLTILKGTNEPNGYPDWLQWALSVIWARLLASVNMANKQTLIKNALLVDLWQG